MTGRYGEHDVEHYDRPRRRTRPRTKERPSYDDAVDGHVMTVDRGRFTLLVDGRRVMAMKARPLGRKGVVVGDRVRVVGDVSGDEGSLARIVLVDERTTTLRRTADDTDPVERILVGVAPRRPAHSSALQNVAKSGKVFDVVATFSTSTPSTAAPTITPACAIRWSA